VSAVEVEARVALRLRSCCGAAEKSWVGECICRAGAVNPVCPGDLPSLMTGAGPRRKYSFAALTRTGLSLKTGGKGSGSPSCTRRFGSALVSLASGAQESRAPSATRRSGPRAEIDQISVPSGTAASAPQPINSRARRFPIAHDCHLHSRQPGCWHGAAVRRCVG
jgi:hypothetical protein